MSTQRKRVLAVVLCALVAVWTAGCGGSSSGSSTSSGSGSGSGGSGGSGGSSSPTTVTFNFNGSAPTVAAVKVGTGSYAVQAATDGKLTFSVPSGTTNFSVAFLCPFNTPGVSSGTYVETVDFASTLDGTSFTRDCYVASSTPVTLDNLDGDLDVSTFPTAQTMQAVVQGVDSAGALYLNLVGPLPASGSTQLQGPVGSDSVVMGIFDSSKTMIAAKAFSNQTVPGNLNGGKTVVFGAGDAAPTEPITLANVPAGAGTPQTSASAYFFTMASGNLTEYPAFPAGVLPNGYYYTIRSTEYQNSSPLNASEEAIAYPSNAGAVTLTYPDPWTTTAPAAAVNPAFNFDYTGFAGKPNVYYDGYQLWTPSGSNFSSEVVVRATANYLGSATTIAMPDLSSISGFLAPPASGVDVFWQEAIGQESFASGASPADGTVKEVSVYGTYTVP
ncbi:MAG TPA: hypothetical protein VG844_00750 [Terracidiphilus sp.]|nr:hypothetical protein [Terracidiphilus sp.]